jgi:hypothetical protein
MGHRHRQAIPRGWRRKRRAVRRCSAATSGHRQGREQFLMTKDELIERNNELMDQNDDLFDQLQFLQFIEQMAAL